MNTPLYPKSRKQRSRLVHFRQLRHSFLKQLIPAILWTGVLFLLTCVASLEQLLLHQNLHFTFNPSPELMEFFKIDFKIAHEKWVVIKLGHFLGFAILFLFLSQLFENVNSAILLAVLLAVLTEILQLFFSRDGRLLDIGIDSAGIIIAYLTCQLRGHKKKRN